MKKVLLVLVFFAATLFLLSSHVLTEPIDARAVQASNDGGVSAVKPAVVALPPRPETRIIPRRIGDLLYLLKVNPGIPEPGDIIEFILDVARTTQAPNMVFSDRSPLAGLRITAKVSHEKAPDAAIMYVVQAFGDAGMYGFHYTPDATGNYLLVFSVIAEGKDCVEVKFVIPVGIWPLPADTDVGDSMSDEKKASDKPRGAGIVMPVAPTTLGGVVHQEDKKIEFKKQMGVLNKLWVFVGKFISIDRPADLKVAAREANTVALVAEKLAGLAKERIFPQPDEFQALSAMLVKSSKELSATAAAGNAVKTGELYNTITYNSCTRCHLKYRFQAADSLTKYPAVGQEK